MLNVKPKCQQNCIVKKCVRPSCDNTWVQTVLLDWPTCGMMQLMQKCPPPEVSQIGLWTAQPSAPTCLQWRIEKFQCDQTTVPMTIRRGSARPRKHAPTIRQIGQSGAGREAEKETYGVGPNRTQIQSGSHECVNARDYCKSMRNVDICRRHPRQYEIVMFACTSLSYRPCMLKYMLWLRFGMATRGPQIF